MNVVAPCKFCECKGCGSYHNECPEYKKYRDKIESEQKKKFETNKINEFLNRYESEKKKSLYKKYKR